MGDESQSQACCGACAHAELAAQGKVNYAPSPPLTIGAGGGTLFVSRRSGRSLARVALTRGSRLTVGRRGSGCDIQIDDEALSRRTCAIEVTDAGSVFIADLNSACGTVVNGEKIARRGLHERDVIMVGFSMLTFFELA